MMDKSKFNERSEWRKFGIGLGIILAVIATIQLIFGKTLYPYFYAAGVVVVITAFAAPVILKPVFILFSYIGFGIGWVMTRIILTVLFYLIITPVSVLAKVFGTKFLDLEIDKNSESYWLEREDKEPSKESFEKQF